MVYEIITHGGGDALWHAFNAMAALFKAQGAIATLLSISMNFCVIIAVTRMVLSQDMLSAFKWSIASVVILNSLLLPKIPVVIIDRVAQFQRRVDNVPFILGFFASTSSRVGDFLAQKFDEVFAPAGLEYTQTGIAMASKLVSKARTLTVPNPDAAANLKAFVQQCMVPDVARGKYTLQDIRNAPDLWQFLSDHASPIRGFPYRFGARDTRILTCREVARGNRTPWERYVNDAAKQAGPQYFPLSRPERAAQQLLSQLEVSYQYLTGLSLDASQILRQNMMRNLIAEGLIELNAQNGTQEAIQSYAVLRAQEQQKTAYALQGEMASLSLSTLKVVVEILFYGLFPMAATLALFPGGWRVLKEYLIAMFWIQSWAPMYAVLNMIVNLYAKAKSVAALTVASNGAPQTVLAWSTIPKLGEANEWISAVAGYAMMSIPFLSYGIFKYGAGALTQMASHFGGITQSSASRASEEATTGSMAIGNTNFDNHSMSNTHGFKYDTNTSIATGKTTMQELDGNLSHRMPDGQRSYDMTPATPKLASNLKMSDSLSTAFHESANQSIQTAQQQSQSAVSNTTAAFNALNEFRQARSRDVNNAESYSQQESALKDTAFGQYDDLVTRFAQDHKMDKAVATSLFAEISGGPSIPGIGAMKVGSKLSRTGTDSETISQAKDYASKHGMSEMLKHATQEAQEGRLNFLNSDNKHYGDAINASLNQADSHARSAQASLSKADYYQQQASHVKQNGLSIDQDLTKQYWDSLISSYGEAKAQAIVSNPASNYEHMQQFSAAKRDQLINQFEAQRPTDPVSVEKAYQAQKSEVENSHHLQDTLDSYRAVVLEKRDQAGLNEPIKTTLKESVQENISGAAALLGDKKVEVQNDAQKIKDKYNPGIVKPVMDQDPKTFVD